MAAQIKQGDHATWAITPHVFVGRKTGWHHILWKWYSTTSGPVALPQIGKKEGCYYCEVFPPQRMSPHEGPVESVVFAYYRLGLGLRRRSLRRQGGLRRSAFLSIASCTPTVDVTPRGIVWQCSIRHTRCSSGNVLEEFLN